jgi:hypothetical protein
VLKSASDIIFLLNVMSIFDRKRARSCWAELIAFWHLMGFYFWVRVSRLCRPNLRFPSQAAKPGAAHPTRLCVAKAKA